MEKKLISVDIIRQKLACEEPLDFVGLDLLQNNTYTPLMYCISTNEQELFSQLIDAGADINLQDPNTNWNPLVIAMQVASSSFFIKELLKRDDIDVYQKVYGKNVLFHSYRGKIFPQRKDSFDKLEILVDYLKNKKDFDHQMFFENNCDVFCDLQLEAFSVLLSLMPRKWLEFIIENVNSESLVKKGKVELKEVRLFDKLFKSAGVNFSDLSLSDLAENIVDAIEKDKVCSETGRSLFTFLFEKSRYAKNEEELLIHLFLKHGFDPYLVDAGGFKAADLLKSLGSKTFLNWELNKNLNNVNEVDFKSRNKL